MQLFLFDESWTSFREISRLLLGEKDMEPQHADPMDISYLSLPSLEVIFIESALQQHVARVIENTQKYQCATTAKVFMWMMTVDTFPHMSVAMEDSCGWTLLHAVAGCMAKPQFMHLSQHEHHEWVKGLGHNPAKQPSLIMA